MDGEYPDMSECNVHGIVPVISSVIRKELDGDFDVNEDGMALRSQNFLGFLTTTYVNTLSQRINIHSNAKSGPITTSNGSYIHTRPATLKNKC